MIPTCVVLTTLGKIALPPGVGDSTTGLRIMGYVDTVIDPIVLKRTDVLANHWPTRTVARHARFL